MRERQLKLIMIRETSLPTAAPPPGYVYIKSVYKSCLRGRGGGYNLPLGAGAGAEVGGGAPRGPLALEGRPICCPSTAAF